MSETSINQYSEERARNEAIELQRHLYGNKTPYLRAYKGFDSDDYKAIEDAKREQNIIINMILNLPKEQPERGRKIAELIRTKNFNDICNAWRELEYPHQVSKEYKKFSELAYLIFEETDKNFVGHKAPKEQGSFNYETPSTFYMALAFALYQRISGEDFTTAEELKNNFAKAVKGKKVLELACGPGWFLHLLKSFGAEVSGIEKNTDSTYSNIYRNLNIKIGDALNIQKSFPDKFDIVLTNNFLNNLCVSPEEEAITLIEIHKALNPGGVSINSTQDFEGSVELRRLLAIQDLAGKDQTLIRQTLESLINPQYNGDVVILDIHKPALPEQTIKKAGLNKLAIYKEGQYFVFSFEK